MCVCGGGIHTELGYAESIVRRRMTTACAVEISRSGACTVYTMRPMHIDQHSAKDGREREGRLR